MKIGMSAAAAVRFRRDHDLAAVLEQEAGDIGDAHQELLAGDLPGRPGGAGFRQALRHRAAPNRHLRRAPAAPAISPGSSISLATESPETR